MTLAMMDNDKDSNMVRVMKETTAGIEWKGRVDNASKGGGRGGGGGGGDTWWRNISDEAKDENTQPPWEFNDKEPMEETGMAAPDEHARCHATNGRTTRWLIYFLD